MRCVWVREKAGFPQLIQALEQETSLSWADSASPGADRGGDLDPARRLVVADPQAEGVEDPTF
jgi:hypothetical protein